MAAMGDLLFVATIYDGAFVFDVSDPAAPVEIASGPLATTAEGEVSSEGNLVLVAEEEAGIEIFDLGVCFAEPPTPDFTWRPGNPEAGRNVQLTDTSVGSIDTRRWDFGDGSTGSQRNPSHVWAEPGDYEVRLSVDGPQGNRQVIKTITVDPRTGGVPPITDPGEYSYVIAAASHAQGLSNTNWVTDVVLHNPGTSAAEGYIWFMKGGQNNLGADGQPVAVSPGASLLIEDIVLSLFGEDDASGALLIGSDQPLLVTSRTYNDASSGTFGQFIPGREIESAVGRNEEVRLIQLTRSSTFRTNLGVANPTGNGITVTVSLQDAGGTEFASRSLTVPPFGFLQKTDILGADVADAVAVVSSSTQDAAFFPYASVVDNRTGDPMMVEPIQPGNEVVIAAAAHVGGLEDTDWRTDLEVCNFNGVVTEFDLDLLMTDHDNTSPQSVSMSLAGTTCERVSDVLDASFSYEGSAALAIQSHKGELTVSSRTFNTTDTGTYGQFLPGVSATAAVAAGKEARIIQLAQSTGSSTGFRTNIGLVNRAGTPTAVVLDLRFDTGTSLGILNVTLQPYEHRQINRVFRQVTSGQVSNGFAVVTTSSAGGSFIAYASVVDNASGDPVFIPGMVVGD
jgi:PKD repeat protein